MRYTICMKERETANICVAVVPPGLMIFRTSGAYQKLHLCEYLRELPEYPVTEAEETHERGVSSPFPSPPGRPLTRYTEFC